MKSIIAGGLVAVGLVASSLAVAHAAGQGDVTSFHIKDGTVRERDTSPWMQRQFDRNTNQTDRLDNQKAQLNELQNVERHADGPYGADLPGQDSSSTALPAGQTTVVWTACAPGEHALSGGFRVGDLSQESFATGNVSYPDLQVIATEPAYYKDGTLVNGAVEAPMNDNLAFEPNAWAVTVHNAGADSVARAFVVCES